MPKKLNIIFDAQNDAQKFGVPCGRGCFLRYLMRADFAQRVVVCSAISGIDLHGFRLGQRAMWRASCSVLRGLDVEAPRVNPCSAVITTGADGIPSFTGYRVLRPGQSKGVVGDPFMGVDRCD